jgi:hydrogenase nickel incorporation protein HypA/HybF
LKPGPFLHRIGWLSKSRIGKDFVHELAIANSIVKTVLEEAKRQNFRSVTSVGLRIGALTDIVPEALEFGFSAITDGTLLEGASLKIENVPVRGNCRACGKGFEVNEFVFVCPDCESSDIEVSQGQELDIVFIEVKDNQPEKD